MTPDAIRGNSDSRSVVLVCLDSVRADVYEEYANRLSSLAAVDYGQCRAASSWSTPSHASMLTGRLPHVHGVHTHNRTFSGVDVSETFLSDLNEYRTVGISSNVWASSNFGFDQYFDRFHEVHDMCRFPRGIDVRDIISESGEKKMGMYTEVLLQCLRHENQLESIANAVLAQVNSLSRNLPIPKLLDDGAKAVLRTAMHEVQRANRPYFLFLNIMDPHIALSPTWGYDHSLYSVPNTWSSDEYSVWELIESDDNHEKYWRRRRELYSAVIDYVDKQVAKFVEELRRVSGTDVSFIITADHGDNLGTEVDESLANHKSSLSEGVLHVPLQVIDPPNDFETRTEQYVSHLQLGNLVVALADGKPYDPTSDRIAAELVGLSAGPSPDKDADYWDRMQRCAYDGEQKFVWDSRRNSMTYDIDFDSRCWQSDRGEGIKIPDWCRRMFETEIREFKSEASRSTSKNDINAGTAKRLKDLGYL